MATGAAFDITGMAELEWLADEVRASGTSCVLKRGDEEIAVLAPVTTHHRPRADQARRVHAFKPTSEQLEAPYASAGTWSDVDTERLIADVYADRERNLAPPLGTEEGR